MSDPIILAVVCVVAIAIAAMAICAIVFGRGLNLAAEPKKLNIGIGAENGRSA